MLQQVNLYQPVFRREDKIFSSRTLLVVWGLVLLLLATVYIFQTVKLLSAERQATQVHAQYEALDQQLAKLQGQSDPAQRDALDQQLEQLEQTRGNLLTLLDTLQGPGLADRQHFSQVLEGLAQIRLPGLWLTGIDIDGTGNMRLSGRASDEHLVPRYLAKLTASPALPGKPFVQILLNSNPDTGSVDFVLQSGGDSW